MSPTSYLLILPAELRLQIYSHVFETGAPAHSTGRCTGEVDIEISQSVIVRRKEGVGRSARRHFTAILRTCKQIHTEAINSLYDQTLFCISTRSAGAEIVDAAGRLRLRTSNTSDGTVDESGVLYLRDLTFFDKMQHVHINVNIGKLANPMGSVLPVTRAIIATLPSSRKSTTAALRFDLMAAITCARLSDEAWLRLEGAIGAIPFGCGPDVEVDEEVERWTKYGRRHIFEALATVMGGRLRYVKFQHRVGPQQWTLMACTPQ